MENSRSIHSILKTGLILLLAVFATGCSKEATVESPEVPVDATAEARAEPAAPIPEATSLANSEEVTAPFPIERVDADLTPCEGRMREAGLPIVRVVIDQEGVVRDVSPLQPTESCVQKAFVEAVRQWKFRPAMKNGQPITVEFNIAMSPQP